MEEDLRKSRHRYDECERKRIEITEKYEKKVREVTKIQESLKRVETERDELYHKIEHLQREIDAKCADWEDAEDRCGKWKLKFEHCERELVSIREKIRTLEIERTELRESVTKIREEHRLVVIERDQLKEDYHNECKKSAEHHRKILVLQESLRRTETTVKELREEVHTLTEKIVRIESERDAAVHRCGDLDIELGELKASVVKLKLEISKPSHSPLQTMLTRPQPRSPSPATASAKSSTAGSTSTSKSAKPSPTTTTTARASSTRSRPCGPCCARRASRRRRRLRRATVRIASAMRRLQGTRRSAARWSAGRRV
jgi:predicted  nucleic acid-binding Zn-ribbon protein